MKVEKAMVLMNGSKEGEESESMNDELLYSWPEGRKIMKYFDQR